MRLLIVLLVAGWLSLSYAAVDFDQTNHGATLPSAALNLNTGTICMWFAPDDAATDATTHHFLDSDTARHATWVGSSTAAMYNDGRQTTFSTGVTWTTGVYSHFCWLYNKTGNIQRIFLNGVELSADTPTGTWGATALGTSFHIGQRFNATERHDGDVAEVATWNVVLTDPEIVALSKRYAANCVRRTALLSYVKFIQDGTPTHGPNAATLINAPPVSTHPPIINCQ